MDGNVTEVRAGQVTRSGSGVALSADQLAEVLRVFTAELAGPEQAFGTGRIGRAIAGCYGDVRTEALDTYRDNIQALGAQGGDVRTLGMRFQRASEMSADLTRQLGEGLG
ncbi:hypothetical protein GCM10022251_25510 [Phytohabitans flavus]|uniref:hypothetical protein n=1 Tax=Phytohabitans flavus TaxID=1076124 RepID=UPI0031EDD031